MSVRVHVWLNIVSERRSPEEIASLVGMTPDSCWRIGDLRNQAPVRHTNNGWVIESGLPKEGAEPEVHLEHLVARVRPYADNIRAIATEDEVSVMCAIYTEEHLVLPLEPWIVQEVARMGAGLGIDIYIVPPAKRQRPRTNAAGARRSKSQPGASPRSKRSRRTRSR